MTIAEPNHLKRVLSEISSRGLLLESDPKLPSVCSVVTGAPIKGSWWSHPLGQIIFQVNETLEDHPDVLLTKLVSGKVTFIHRSIWSEVLAVGTSRQSWQTKTLSASAKTLLATVSGLGMLRTDKIDLKRLRGAKLGDLARELERRLLVHAEQLHTESGSHAKVLETWEHWCDRKRFAPVSIQPNEAKRSLEERLRKLNEEFGGTARLPWA
jgi:hypothetical protein